MIAGARTLIATIAMGVAVCPARAAVRIDITEVGTDVVLMASGTFDASLASFLYGAETSGAAIMPVTGLVTFGDAGSVSVYRLTGPYGFGPGTGTIVATGLTGQRIGLFGSFSDFLIAADYVSNAAIASSAVVRDANLSSLGLESGIYRYAVGGNAVTMTIGASATPVPEPVGWAPMVLGLGLAGGIFRRCRACRAVPV